MSKWKEQREAEERAAREEEEKKATLKDFEDGVAGDLNTIQAAFRERMKNEEKRTKDVCDANYYFTVYFSNFDQLKEFCTNFNLDCNQMYIDGREFSKQLKKSLKTPDTEFPRTQPFNKDYVSRARDK